MRFWLKDWCAIRFKGSDHRDWLQGQLTQDVRSSDKHAFGWCEPSGRLLSFGVMLEQDVQTIVFVPLATLPAIHKRIEDMVILEDVEEVSKPGYVLWSSQNVSKSSISIQTAWGCFELSDSALDQTPYEERTAAQLERGFPQWGIDIGTQTIPFDMGPAFINETVSFNKGCYIGQEILARIHSMERHTREWVGLITKAQVHRDDCIGNFGRITSSSQLSTLGFIASASFSKHTVVEGEIVEVITESGNVEAEVRRMPLLRQA